MTRGSLQRMLPGYRLVHFAGHADPPTGEEPGGWRMADGALDAAAFAALGRLRTRPERGLSEAPLAVVTEDPGVWKRAARTMWLWGDDRIAPILSPCGGLMVELGRGPGGNVGLGVAADQEVPW